MQGVKRKLIFYILGNTLAGYGLIRRSPLEHWRAENLSCMASCCAVKSSEHYAALVGKEAYRVAFLAGSKPKQSFDPFSWMRAFRADRNGLFGSGEAGHPPVLRLSLRPLQTDDSFHQNLSYRQCTRIYTQ